MKNTLRLAWEGVLDLVYPPRCLVCERYDLPVLCEECHASFAPIPEPLCPVCGRPEEADLSCRLCSEAVSAHGGWGFDAARATGVYWGPLRHAIHELKYHKTELLGGPLGEHLAVRCVVDHVLEPAVLARVEAVIPVPLHRAKERVRGFNQAELLATPLAVMQGIPLLSDAVRRAQKAPAQVGLSPGQRWLNMGEGMFEVDASSVAGKVLLLVDDVFTTGATVSACAGALKEAGAREVYAVTLAGGG